MVSTAIPIRYFRIHVSSKTVRKERRTFAQCAVYTAAHSLLGTVAIALTGPGSGNSATAVRPRRSFLRHESVRSPARDPPRNLAVAIEPPSPRKQDGRGDHAEPSNLGHVF